MTRRLFMQKCRPRAWNIVHRYNFSPIFLTERLHLLPISITLVTIHDFRALSQEQGLESPPVIIPDTGV